MQNKKPSQTEAEQVHRRKLREAQAHLPWNKHIVANKAEMELWVCHPAWLKFQAYLNDLAGLYTAGLIGGSYDEKGHDLSDIQRGMIRLLRDLAQFDEAVRNIKKEQSDGMAGA